MEVTGGYREVARKTSELPRKPDEKGAKAMEVAGGCREVAHKASELPRKPDEKGAKATEGRAELFFQVQRVVHALLFGEQVAAIVLIGGDFHGHILDNPR